MCSKVNEKRKSKLLLTLFALGITLTLCGCMKSVELKERTIIRMVGVDVDGQDFVLTMSQFSPQTQSGEKSSSRTQVVQTRGSSISDAIDEVSRYSGNEVFLGNSSFLVVGRTAAKLGLEKVLNFFNANHEVSPELYVAMAQGEAAEIIQVQSQGDSGPTQLKSLVEQGQENGLLGRPTLKDIVNRLQGEYTQPYLPLIETVPSQDGEERLRIAGMAIFRDGKLLDTLSIDQTRGVLWATDELSRAIVTVDFGEQNRSRVSVELEESKSTMQVGLRDGKPVLRLSIRIEAGIKEVLSETGGGVEIDQLPQIQNAVSARIRSTVEEVVDQVFFSQKSDIFRYSEFIRKEEPDYWKQHHEDFEQVVEDCTFGIDVECIIDHPGLEASHTQENS